MLVLKFENVRDRYIPDYERLAQIVQACRVLGLKIVLTSGSYDIIHEGHMDYLEAAKALGDVLIVAVDSDEKVRTRKQKDEYTLRPFFSQDVRIRQLCGQRPVDLVTLKDADQEKWTLIKLIRPDVLQATKGTYDDEQLQALEEFCGKIVVQSPFATTGTSENLRRMMRSGAKQFGDRLSQVIPQEIEKVLLELHSPPKEEER